nr:GPI-anchored adhesin-like protein precursor [Ipomoea batatas]GMD74125.1 GPI-anchored adhesin-like protein precursor [Ipomoea batatas]GME14323.1 GPI-anchored adhesin-like protein precursor [Ipomoea batatas]
MHKNFEGNPFSKGKGPKDGGVIHAKGDCNNNPRPHSFVNLSSGNCAGKNSSSASTISNENVSSGAIFNGNSKNTENSMQSSDGVLSAKSEVDTWRAPGKLTYTGEDEIHDASQRTESSCSNSYFIHPVCSSNDNFQETSMETKSSVPNGFSSAVPAGAECITEAGTVASVTTAQFTRHTRDKEEYCDKLDRSSLPPKKGTQEIEEMLDDYRGLTGKKCSCSMNRDIICGALEDRKVLAAEKQSRMMKHEYVAAEEENELVNSFDLNDDIPRSALNNHKQSVSEALSSSNVVRPMAKLGVPLCLPSSTQKFGGELGWRGTAATSAFCLVSSPKDDNAFSAVKTDHSSRDSRGSTVIDLNLTAEEDCPAIGFPWANEKKPKHSSYSDSKPEEKFSFDLNAPGDNADDCPQSCFPVNFTKNASMDLNLNDDPSIREACGDHLQLQRNQPFGIKTPEQAAVPSLPTKRHPREHLNILGPVYRGDLSHMQVFNHARGQPVLVAAPNLLQPVDRLHRFVPLQPQLSPYTMQAVPSYCYPSNGSFFIAQADSLPAHNLCYGALPPTRNPHGNAVFPQVLNAGGVPNFPGAPYLLGPVPRGQTPSGGAELQPRYEIHSGDFSSMNGSWKENTTRQLLIPSQNTELKFSQQAITPTKRREPEGGWEAYQLGLKHTPSSH